MGGENCDEKSFDLPPPRTEPTPDTALTQLARGVLEVSTCSSRCPWSHGLQDWPAQGQGAGEEATENGLAPVTPHRCPQVAPPVGTVAYLECWSFQEATPVLAADCVESGHGDWMAWSSPCRHWSCALRARPRQDPAVTTELHLQQMVTAEAHPDQD